MSTSVQVLLICEVEVHRVILQQDGTTLYNYIIKHIYISWNSCLYRV